MAANSRVGAWPLLLSSQLSLDVLDVKPDLPESPDAFWSVLLINVDGVFGEVAVMCVVGTVYRLLCACVCLADESSRFFSRLVCAREKNSGTLFASVE